VKGSIGNAAMYVKEILDTKARCYWWLWSFV